MKLKLDENLGHSVRRLLELGGHKVVTVFDEGLSEGADDDVLNAATAEHCALVTLDLDFANPLRYVPSRYAGIVLLRLRSKPSHEDILILARTLAGFLEREQPFGRLWIVERGRVRVYQEPAPDPCD